MSAGAINPIWRALQALSVASAVTVLALLLVSPELGLFITWYVLIPIVPLTLLIAPLVWRNLCPIAVLSQLPLQLGARPRRRLPLSPGRGATYGAALLFLGIVPLRPMLFNESAPAVAILTVAVIVVAIAGGLVFSGKSGWCATLCPVLPVERIYGQQQFIGAPHAHCRTCDTCARACIDLRPKSSLRELAELAGASSRLGLFGTPMGWFAAAFPGFIVGYFQVNTETSLVMTYVAILGWSSASALIIGSLSAIPAFGIRTSIRAVAIVAVVLYYWYTIPAIGIAAERLGRTSPEELQAQGDLDARNDAPVIPIRTSSVDAALPSE